jgi:hypothetical protein
LLIAKFLACAVDDSRFLWNANGAMVALAKVETDG